MMDRGEGRTGCSEMEVMALGQKERNVVQYRHWQGGKRKRKRKRKKRAFVSKLPSLFGFKTVKFLRF